MKMTTPWISHLCVKACESIMRPSTSYGGDVLAHFIRVRNTAPVTFSLSAEENQNREVSSPVLQAAHIFCNLKVF